MPAHVDTLELSKAFENAGHRPAMAQGMTRAISDIAMSDVPSSSDVRESVREAVHTMTVRVGLMIGGSTLALIVAVVGSLVSLSR